MAYSKFTLAQLRTQFGVENQVANIFVDTLLVPPSSALLHALELAKEYPISTEKARSEYLIVPILEEIRVRSDKFFVIYSGEVLNADKQQGLSGECDFIMTKNLQTFDINYPILQIVETLLQRY